MAWEVQQKLKSKGIICDLISGQKKEKTPFSTHTSATIESLNELAKNENEYEVAIIVFLLKNNLKDEIQMMTDPERGHHWTNALLSLKAKEIHLCGSPRIFAPLEKVLSPINETVFVGKNITKIAFCNRI